MNKPDLRLLAHQGLDETTGELTSLVVITTHNDGVQVMIGGYTPKIISSLAVAMHNNPEFRRYFEEAWAACTKVEAGLN